MDPCEYNRGSGMQTQESLPDGGIRVTVVTSGKERRLNASAFA